MRIFRLQTFRLAANQHQTGDPSLKAEVMGSGNPEVEWIS